MDKPWPTVTFPVCKLILHRGCAPDDTLWQVCCDTLEQACFGRIMARWTPPTNAEYLYIGCPDDAAPAYRHSYLFDTDEQLLHRRLCKRAPTCTFFAFRKISMSYAHRADERFMAVYYPGDEISPAEQAVIDKLMTFPCDDSLAFYHACMQHASNHTFALQFELQTDLKLK